MTEITGPVEILAVGFREGARFEGRIAEQIDRLVQAGTIRVLDFVFLRRDEATGALVRMDRDGPEAEGRLTALLDGRPPVRPPCWPGTGRSPPPRPGRSPPTPPCAGWSATHSPAPCWTTAAPPTNHRPRSPTT